MKEHPKRKYPIISHLRDLLIVVLIGLGITFAFNGGENFWENAHMMVTYSLLIGGTLWKGNELIGYLMTKYLPWDEKPGRTYWLSWAAMLAFSFVDILLVNAFWNAIWVKTEWSNFFNAFRMTMFVEFLVSMAITGFFYTLAFFHHYKKAQIEKAQIEKQVIAARYQALRNQLNPHFLFNCFSTLDSLIHIDSSKASDFVQKLSQMYRYVLDQKELVHLEKELEFVDTYIFLEKMRFGDKLRIEKDIRQADDVQVPPMSVQLLVENAVKHNVISHEHPLVIRMERRGDRMVISNARRSKSQNSAGTGTGLSNLGERIRFLSGHDLEIEQSGEIFRVSLPLISLKAKEA